MLNSSIVQTPQSETEFLVTHQDKRGGYHACSYETFLKLKRLHAAYWDSVVKFAQYIRWNNKKEHNRVIRRVTKRNERGQPIQREVVGNQAEPPLPSPVFKYKTDGNVKTMPERVVDNGVLLAYQNARMPKSVPDHVQPLGISGAEIDTLIALLDTYQSNT